MRIFPLVLFLTAMLASAEGQDPIGRQESDSGIRHSFVISGPRTALIGDLGATASTLSYIPVDEIMQQLGKFRVLSCKVFQGH